MEPSRVGIVKIGKTLITLPSTINFCLLGDSCLKTGRVTLMHRFSFYLLDFSLSHKSLLLSHCNMSDPSCTKIKLS